MTSADDIIRLLDLAPHPEGGHFRETFRDEAGSGGRSASTAIYFLLKRGERSHWHRVDAAEVWHWHAGAPLALHTAGAVADSSELAAAPDPLLGRASLPESSVTPFGRRSGGHDIATARLGTDLAAGERPQAVVPAGIWQAAESLGDWTLVGCTVAPGFEFSGFELAPPGWSPAVA